MRGQHLQKARRHPRHQMPAHRLHTMPAMLRLERHCMFGRGLKIVAMLDQLRPQCAHRGILLDRVPLWDNDHRAKPVLPRRQRNRLTMVPPRGRDHGAARSQLRPQRVHVDQPTPHLERPNRHVVLMLHPDRPAGPRIDLRPCVLRRGRQVPRHQLSRGPNLIHPWQQLVSHAFHHATRNGGFVTQR